MTITRRRAATIAAATLVLAPRVWAQGFPAKPIRFVVPWPPGGATSVIARVVGDEMQKSLGQPMVYDHRPGAGGALGSDIVAKSAGDGYTILIAGAGTFYRPLIDKDTPFKPDRDFGFIGPIGDGPFMLVTRTGLPKTLAEFIAHAKANPGKLNFASSGQGSTSHLTAELFNRAAAIQATHVPFRGSVPAMTDLLAGRVDYFFDAFTTTVENVSAGKIQALGVTTSVRAAQAPDIPTIAEAGLAGFSAAPWWGIVGPAGMPREAVERLSAGLRKALANAEIVKSLADQGCRAFALSPAEFEAFVRAENAKWSAVIEAAGLKVT
jgi:tripartite-type tricarboxylate transporter receptor subunit TctC